MSDVNQTQPHYRKILWGHDVIKTWQWPVRIVHFSATSLKATEWFESVYRVSNLGLLRPNYIFLRLSRAKLFDVIKHPYQAFSLSLNTLQGWTPKNKTKYQTFVINSHTVTFQLLLADICHIIWRVEVNVKGRFAFVYIYIRADVCEMQTAGWCHASVQLCWPGPVTVQSMMQTTHSPWLPDWQNNS